MRVEIQGVGPVAKHSLGGRRTTSRAKGLLEPSTTVCTRTIDLIHRPAFAFCKEDDQLLKISSQVLEPLRNRASLKTGAVEAASNYS